MSSNDSKNKISQDEIKPSEIELEASSYAADKKINKEPLKEENYKRMMESKIQSSIVQVSTTEKNEMKTEIVKKDNKTYEFKKIFNKLILESPEIS